MKMSIRFTCILIVFVMLLSAMMIVPASAIANQTGDYIVTVKGNLNIRPSNSNGTPNPNGTPVGQYKNGDKVNVTSISGNWGKTSKGWISLEYAGLSNKTGQVPATSKVRIEAENLNLRSGGGTSFDSHGKLNFHEIVDLYDPGIIQNGYRWYMVKRSNGTFGYFGNPIPDNRLTSYFVPVSELL